MSGVYQQPFSTDGAGTVQGGRVTAPRAARQTSLTPFRLLTEDESGRWATDSWTHRITRIFCRVWVSFGTVNVGACISSSVQFGKWQLRCTCDLKLSSVAIDTDLHYLYLCVWQPSACWFTFAPILDMLYRMIWLIGIVACFLYDGLFLFDMIKLS